MSLTDLQIRKLKAPARGQKTYFDDAPKGFGVRVSQGGAKSFVVLLGESRKRKTIGRYPEVSLSEARAKAKLLQADYALTERDENADAPALPFPEAREIYLRDAATRTKPRTIEEYRRLLEAHFHFAQRLDQISRKDVAKVVDGIIGRPAEKKHAFVAIRTMMNWCIRRGWIDASPVPKVSFATNSRARVLTDAELKVVWRRAEEFGFPYGRIIQLLIATGQRRGEIAGLEWSWIDGDAITFPHGFTKNKREHRLPLSEVTRSLLDSCPESEGLVFPARGRPHTPFNGWSKSKPRFDQVIDVEPYTLHDLRRTFSSNMARIGTPIHVTEKILNHVSGTLSGVAAVYNRYLYMEEMRQALDRHDEFLRSLAGD